MPTSESRRFSMVQAIPFNSFRSNDYPSFHERSLNDAFRYAAEHEADLKHGLLRSVAVKPLRQAWRCHDKEGASSRPPHKKTAHVQKAQAPRRRLSPAK